MLAQLREYVQQLIESEQYDDIFGVWHFGDGVECGVCTNAAIRVAEKFSGYVWGYRAAENPTAGIGRSICDGHDFSIVGDRWLVDY